jgi:UDP:flavonoid glycosyltransferase YjiC (YdhE family)
MEGMPMIVIPKSFDQPAVADRLEWLGVAEVVSPANISAQRLRSALSKVLNDPSYRNAAREVQTKMRSVRGLQRASDVIEKALELHAV